jgi:hypothetical protein
MWHMTEVPSGTLMPARVVSRDAFLNTSLAGGFRRNASSATAVATADLDTTCRPRYHIQTVAEICAREQSQSLIMSPPQKGHTHLFVVVSYEQNKTTEHSWTRNRLCTKGNSWKDGRGLQEAGAAHGCYCAAATRTIRHYVSCIELMHYVSCTCMRMRTYQAATLAWGVKGKSNRSESHTGANCR